MSLRSDRIRRTGAETLAPVLHHASGSPGRPLDASVRAYMEPRFRYDFTGVRVHTDAKAARAATALRASAFTVGKDVYFGPGRYIPDRTEGRKLLAHELTHVVQQDGGTPSLQACCLVEPEHSSAEQEADTASRAIVEDGPLPSPIAAHTRGAVQRSILGDVGGALLGAGAGALLGFAVGGPIGAIAGGILGGVAGLAAGDAESAEKRGLTGEEKTEAEMVFGKSLKYGAVQIAEAPLMAIGENARTPFDTIYFPPGTSKKPFTDFMPWLIHELTHAWQYQHGVSVATKLFWALHGKIAYEYGSEPGLVQAAASGKHFTDFHTEQQGDILSHYYVKLKAGEDTSAYDPFVAEVKNGGRAGGRRTDNRSTADRSTVAA